MCFLLPAAAEPFKANAFKKVADIVDAFPEKITVSARGAWLVSPAS